MSWARQVVVVARAEGQVEARAGDVLWVAAPFGIAALLLAAMAVGADVPLLRDLGPGLYWALMLLFGTLVALRPGTVEPAARRDALLLVGLDPSARFAGRAVVGVATMLVFGLVLWPVLVVLYDPAAAPAAMVLVFLPLVAVGMGALGTLAADLTSTIASRGLLASLLVVPVAVPLAVAGTQAAEGAVYGQSPAPWLLLVLAVDVVVLAAGIAAAPGLMTAPRSSDEPVRRRP